MAIQLATRFHVNISLQELSTKFLPVYGQPGINLHDWLNSDIDLSGKKHILDTTNLTALVVEGGATIKKDMQVEGTLNALTTVQTPDITVSGTLHLTNTTTTPITIASSEMIQNLNAEKIGGHTIDTIYAIAFFFGG
jgi:riboflavin biosynthesis pyrimidine reductase